MACLKPHNAIPLNLNDIKEIYELIRNKYEYFNETLYSKIRPIFCLQTQTLFNTYSLNIKKRKVNIIPMVFYDLNEIRKFNDLNFLDIELFVINTSGDNKYTKVDFEYEQKILDSECPISMHFRHGDFLYMQIKNDWFHVPPLDYYYNCLNLLKQEYKTDQ